MMRLKDWEPRLIAYLQTASRRPYSEADHHCALFAAGCVEAMTGEDHAAQWRGRFKTLKAGLKALKKGGFEDHVALVASLFKDEVHPSRAHRGDLAVLAGSDGMGALGIVQGEHVYVLRPEGLALAPRRQMLRAFRV